MDIAHREHSGAAGFQKQRPLAVKLLQVLTLHVAAGQKEPGVVGRQLIMEPLGVWRGSDKDEQRLSLKPGPLSRDPITEADGPSPRESPRPSRAEEFRRRPQLELSRSMGDRPL